MNQKIYEQIITIIIISFVEGEVTPEQAHEIGVKLAEELWGDKFQVVVSTHINTDNIHNHFVRAPIRGKVIPY